MGRTIHLFTHGGREKPGLTVYPEEHEVRSADQLREVIRFDYMPARCKDNRRAGKNFVSTDCIIADIDNNHSEDPAKWFDVDAVKAIFPDVELYLTPSRNHMRQKREKQTGRILAARPKLHLLFPVNPISDPAAVKRIMHGIIRRFPGAADEAVSDAVRFFYGVADPVVEYHAGTKTVAEFLRELEPEEGKSQHGGCGAGPDHSGDDYERDHIADILRIIPSDDYDLWLKIGFALKYEGFPFEVFDTWSAQSAKYCGRAETLEKWDKLNPDGRITFATIIHEAEAHGYRRPADGARISKAGAAPAGTAAHQSDPAPAGDGPQPGSLDRFHLFNRKGEISGVFDFAILQHLKTENDLLIIGGVPWLYDGGVYRRDERGAKLSTMIRKCIYPQQIRSTTIQRVFNLFLQDAEIQATPEDLNRCPASWICFRNGVFDPVTCTMHPHDPALRLVNQIPHDFEPDAVTRGDAVDEWLRFIAPDEDDREMLLQYSGLILTRDTRQQKFLILTGTGGTGKSTFIRLLEEMVGYENISSVSLSQLVTNRFASFDLLGRLVNCCADLEVGALEDVSTLKKVLGEDSLRAEAKGRDAVNFRSYARLVFSTNELPTVRAERTNGFYRRLLVLPMNRKPDAVRADFFDQLRGDLPHFLRLCVDALGRMYRRGVILESTHSTEAVNQLRKDSDSVEAFLQEEAEPKTNERIERGTLYSRYAAYCEREGREPMQNKGFFAALRAKGLSEIKTGNKRFFQGIGWRASALSSALDDALADGFVPSDEPLPFMRR